MKDSELQNKIQVPSDMRFQEDSASRKTVHLAGALVQVNRTDLVTMPFGNLREIKEV